MGKPACSDDEFIALFKTHGPRDMANVLGISERGVLARRNRMETRLGISIDGPNTDKFVRNFRTIRAQQRLHENVDDGVILVASDAHYWPGPASTAHRGLVALCKALKPKIVVMNGDLLDGARISRHARIGWDERPTLVEEIETCKERLAEIRKAAPKKTKFIWPLGNHDARFETMLANKVPEYAQVNGFKLQDHFPWWEPCWSIWINDDVVIKHRYKGGIHATHNNTMWAGMTIVTSHLHSGKVTPFSDYRGTRWGVDTGTLMDPYPDQTADYSEDAPANHRSGFAALTINGGRLLQPELALVFEDGKMDFRGEIISV